MMLAIKRISICSIIILMLAIPAFGLSSGPGHLNSNNELTVEYGCTCHNNGATSDRAVVMITGVPVMYEPSLSYEFTIYVADSLTLSGGEGNVKAGFLLSSGALGDFTWDEDQDLRDADGRPDDVSHSDTDDDGIWILTWTAPEEDVGNIQFWLAGNSVDGGGLPDEMDYWNYFSFIINAPGTITTTEQSSTLDTRTISVGEDDTLFVLDESPEQLERERQDELSITIFRQGNLFYWTTLLALIVGAIVQKEILERRYDDGPEFLASELAYPQGIRQGIVSLVTFFIAINWASSDTTMVFQKVDFSSFIIGITFTISAWFAYSVYRTILAARKEPEVQDLM